MVMAIFGARELIEPDPGFCKKTSCIQVRYGIWINLTLLTLGLADCFPSIQLPQLTSPASNIFVSMDDEKWIACVLMLFCPIGCLINGYIMDSVGRRISLLCCQIPMFIGWLSIGLGTDVNTIIIGRCLTGIGCGMAMGIPRIYSAEFSLPNMRGFLGAFPNIFLSIGITIQAAVGTYLEWKYLCYIACSLNLTLFFSYLFITESPHFLLIQNNERKTTHALARFRAKDYPVQKEMKRLLEFKRDNNIRRITNGILKTMLCSDAARKPFLLTMTYITLGCLSGIQIVTTFTISLLLWTRSSYDPYAGNFFISVTRLIFSIIGAFLLFRFARRRIAVVSAVGISISSFVMGISLVNNSKPSLAPQVIFMIYTGFAIMGYQCLPFIFMSETYPLQIRGMLMGITLSLTSIMIFLTTKYFPVLQVYLGMSNLFFMFSGFSLIAAVYLFFLLPETKEVSLQEIEEYFNGVRSTLVSDRSVIQAQISYVPSIVSGASSNSRK